MYDLKKYLPTTRKELELRGWSSVDVILFSGDAYVDHPQFGTAVIGRALEAAGYKVAVVPQPDWRGDFRDFTKLGRPRLFFSITAGAMDSMVNHYTANKRLRSNDAYTPDGRAGARPDYCTVTYCRILRTLYPDTPIVIGGIEASMRRFAHYDYWSDTLKPGILLDSKADILIYGPGEKAVVDIARCYDKGGIQCWDEIKKIPQIAYIDDIRHDDAVVLHSFNEELADKRLHAADFALIETESNKVHPKTIVQPVDDAAVSLCVVGKQRWIVVNPPYEVTSADLDEVYDLPYQYLPHPRYKGKRIPAYDMIRFSVCLHRGCFGGCSFCTISAHQGKHIVSRSKESILRQIERLKDLPEWSGVISDLGGPSANMYAIGGKDRGLCEKCARSSCLCPNICRNLNVDFAPLLDIYRSVDALPYVRHSYVGSGVRYDLLNDEYGTEVITKHVSGRLKVAPEHTSDNVLKIMRKPSFENYLRFRDFFYKVNEKAGLKQQLIPYFISSHPGCTNADMKSLADETKRMHYKPEQVQDFTPTPMTLSTTMFYTGLDPYTLKPLYVARTHEEKRAQNRYFFWWKDSVDINNKYKHKK